MRYAGLAWLWMLVTACGGGTPPAGPNPPPSPPPQPPAASWTLSGQIVSTLAGQPVGNARIEAGSLSATTADDGRFTLTQASPPPAALPATITAAGYLERNTAIAWPRASPDVRIDLISLSPPFSLAFYRQLVRDGLESPQLGPVYRWTTAPRVSLHPFDDGGRPLPPEVLATIRAAVPHAVASWSGGLFQGVALEETAVPDWEEGWIVLHALRPSSSEFCGRGSFRYRGAGRIVTGRAELTLDQCACGSRKISPNTVSHEIAHTMGHWHVEGPHVLGPTQGGCSAIEGEVITPREALHAQVAYRRPPGNRDLDRDPEGSALATDQSPGHTRTVVCPPAQRRVP